MNKKIVIFIVLILCALSILAISVWGTLPSNSEKIPVDDINILGPGEVFVNNQGDKIISVHEAITEFSYIFPLSFEILPANATSDIRVTMNKNIGSVSLDALSSLAYITFNQESIGTTVIVTIKDKESGAQDRVILLFEDNTDIIVTDPDPFE